MKRSWRSGSDLLEEDIASSSDAAGAADDDIELSYFAVQVSAFKDKKLAAKAVKEWQKKGYISFLTLPEEDDDLFTRVYIGKFANMDEARRQAKDLQEKENIKSFISLLPGASFPK